jgi:hypothetical protein
MWWLAGLMRAGSGGALAWGRWPGCVRGRAACPGVPVVPGPASLSGLVVAGDDGRHVGYESWLERDHVMALDFDRDVTGVSSRPHPLDPLRKHLSQ